MRYSASMEIISFWYSGQSRIKKISFIYRNKCFVFIVHVFYPPLLFYLYNLWIINWFHSYNFYLHKPYIFIIIMQYAYSRTFWIINLVHSYNFYLLKPYIFVINVQYAYSRTFSPLQAMKYVLVFHHNYWVHSYNFYLLKPYIFIIIVQYAYSRTFCIYKLSLFSQRLSFSSPIFLSPLWNMHVLEHSLPYKPWNMS